MAINKFLKKFKFLNLTNQKLNDFIHSHVALSKDEINQLIKIKLNEKCDNENYLNFGLLTKKDDLSSLFAIGISEKDDLIFQIIKNFKFFKKSNPLNKKKYRQIYLITFNDSSSLKFATLILESILVIRKIFKIKNIPKIDNNLERLDWKEIEGVLSYAANQLKIGFENQRFIIYPSLISKFRKQYNVEGLNMAQKKQAELKFTKIFEMNLKMALYFEKDFRDLMSKLNIGLQNSSNEKSNKINLESELKSYLEYNSESKLEYKSEIKTENTLDYHPKCEPECKSESESNYHSGSHSDIEPEYKSESESDHHSESEPEYKSESESNYHSESESEHYSKSESDHYSESESDRHSGSDLNNDDEDLSNSDCYFCKNFDCGCDSDCKCGCRDFSDITDKESIKNQYSSSKKTAKHLEGLLFEREMIMSMVQKHKIICQNQ